VPLGQIRRHPQPPSGPIACHACADPDPGAHAALTDENVFPASWLGLWRIARVLPAARIGELRG
jgi:hypothetical protein